MRTILTTFLIIVLTISCNQPTNETTSTKDVEIAKLKTEAIEKNKQRIKEVEKEEKEKEYESQAIKVEGLYEVYKCNSNRSFDRNKMLYLVNLESIDKVTHISPDSGGRSYSYEEVENDEIAFKVINYNNEGKTWICEVKGDKSLLIVSGINRDYDMRLGGSVMPLNEDFTKLLMTSTMRDIVIGDNNDVAKSKPVKISEIWIKRQ